MWWDVSLIIEIWIMVWKVSAKRSKSFAGWRWMVDPRKCALNGPSLDLNYEATLGALDGFDRA